MSRTVVANPFTGERLEKPFLLYEDQPLTPEMFYAECPVNGGTASIDTKENSAVHNPYHYQPQKEGGIDCITAMRHAFGDEEVSIFCKLNAFKYNWRCDNKGGVTDISKAVWYLNKYLELNK